MNGAYHEDQMSPRYRYMGSMFKKFKSLKTCDIIKYQNCMDYRNEEGIKFLAADYRSLASGSPVTRSIRRCSWQRSAESKRKARSQRHETYIKTVFCKLPQNAILNIAWKTPADHRTIHPVYEGYKVINR